MTWSYDPTSLGTDTESSRINSVRFLVGDTNTSDQQVQNEEIAFALLQNNNNIYSTASWLASAIASKYARLVDIDLDGQLAEKYSQLYDNYTKLAQSLKLQGKSLGGSLRPYAGGIDPQELKDSLSDTGRVQPAFYKDQFVPKGNQYDPYE